MDLATLSSDPLWVEVERHIPIDFKRLWRKALGWRPRLDSVSQPASAAASAVAQGKRPLLYGWRNDLIAALARSTGLTYVEAGGVAMAARPENRDLLDFMGWTHVAGLPTHVAHAIRGIILGYPLSIIENWVSEHQKHTRSGATPL